MSKKNLQSCLICLFILAGSLFISCGLTDPEQPGALVPPTADQDPNLPQLKVNVMGRNRALHLQTFGDSANPPLFVLPGGPGADFRLMLPLKALSDKYYVVMWDPRGAGLSERVTQEELTIDSFLEEINAVKSALTPQKKLTLCGHSFGADVMAYYTSKYPENVEQVILIEPGPFTDEGRKNYHGGDIESFSVVEGLFWENEVLTSSDHAAADYKAIVILPDANRTFTCDGSIPEDPIWRFGVFHHHVLTHTGHAPGKNFNWGIDELNTFPNEILLVAGTCGAASRDFQQRYNLPHLSNTKLEVIPGAGHMSLFTDYANELLEVMRDHLSGYR